MGSVKRKYVYFVVCGGGGVGLQVFVESLGTHQIMLVN